MFYDTVLGALGYARSTEYVGDVPCRMLRMDARISRAQSLPRTRSGDTQERLLKTDGPCFSIGLHVARSDAAHDRHVAGLHHLALHAESRAAGVPSTTSWCAKACTCSTHRLNTTMRRV